MAKDTESRGLIPAFRLPPDAMEFVETTAEAEGLSRVAVVRRAIIRESRTAKAEEAR
jgi:hypothetical protein